MFNFEAQQLSTVYRFRCDCPKIWVVLKPPWIEDIAAVMATILHSHDRARVCDMRYLSDIVGLNIVVFDKLSISWERFASGQVSVNHWSIAWLRTARVRPSCRKWRNSNVAHFAEAESEQVNLYLTKLACRTDL